MRTTNKSFDYFLAGSPLATMDELWLLAISSDCKIRRRVAENPVAGPYLLRLLSNDPSAEVRGALTDNPMTPMEVLRQLAIDEDPDVRYALAENHNTPIAILKSLESDANPFVALRAGRTKSTNSGKSLASLSRHVDFKPDGGTYCDSVAIRRVLRSSSA